MGLKNLKKAEFCLQLALEAENYTDIKTYKARLYTALGKLSMEYEKWEEAKSWLEKAIRIAKADHNQHGSVLANNSMGDCLMRIEQYDHAIRYYKTAYQLSMMCRLNRKAYQILLRLLKCAQLTDNKVITNYAQNELVNFEIEELKEVE
jgi:tetratricopeptide (TPR) repeat protein